MESILLQAIKSVPRLFWYSYARPSKAYDFFSNNKRNLSIFMWAFFFSGAVFGCLIAISHYFLFHNLFQSLLVAIAIALAFVVSFTRICLFETLFPGVGASPFTFASAFSFSIVFVFAVVLAGAVVIPGALAGFFLVTAAVSGSFAGSFAGSVSGAVAVAIAGAFAVALAFAGVGCYILVILTEEKGICWVKAYEMTIYPFAFLIGYFFNSSYYFIKENRKFKENIKLNRLRDWDITHQKFGRTQKASLLWGPIIAYLLYPPLSWG